MTSSIPFAAALLSVFGCASTFAGTVDQTSTDVQALQAWVAQSIAPVGYQPPGQIVVDLNSCSGPDPAPNASVSRDCSAELSQRATMAADSRLPPAMVPLTVPGVESVNGALESRYLLGNLVEIRAVLKLSAFDSRTFVGVGFYANRPDWSASQQGVVSVTPRAQLDVVGKAKLKDGSPVVVLRFIGWMPFEEGDDGASWAMSTITFKPFAEYDNGPSTYRNWDVHGNETIQRIDNASGASHFDRQAELLQQ